MPEDLIKPFGQFGLAGLCMAAILYAMRFMLERHGVDMQNMATAHELAVTKISEAHERAIDKLSESIEKLVVGLEHLAQEVREVKK